MDKNIEILPISIFAPIIEIEDSFLTQKGVRLFLKREDLIHEHISGNKWRKLKYNLQKAKEENHSRILTFGGAFSNHIAATAYAAKVAHIESIGIIRGEENAINNPTLQFAREQGMKLHFISRSLYREKNNASYQEALKKDFGPFFLVPEGGANAYGMMGCCEIMNGYKESDFDIICCACGTGTTLSGIIHANTSKNTHIIGFPVLLDEKSIQENIILLNNNQIKSKWSLQANYTFGGYSKTNSALIHFIQSFTAKTGVPLDYIYTGKMLYGIYDMIEKEEIKRGTKVLAIHTGGLQGNLGFSYLKQKKE